MNNQIKNTALFLAIFMALNSNAKTKDEKKQWNKEPDNFMGIALNKPINLSNCPIIYDEILRQNIVDEMEVRKTNDVCIDSTKSSYAGFFYIRNTPRINISYTTIAMVENGVVNNISITFNQSDFEKFLNAFKIRYGEPTLTTNATATTLYGAKLESKVVFWQGKNMRISMYERLTKIDESVIEVINPSNINESKSKEFEKESSKF